MNISLTCMFVFVLMFLVFVFLFVFVFRPTFLMLGGVGAQGALTGGTRFRTGGHMEKF